jgi:hypothetical protein
MTSQVTQQGGAGEGCRPERVYSVGPHLELDVTQEAPQRNIATAGSSMAAST